MKIVISFLSFISATLFTMAQAPKTKDGKIRSYLNMGIGRHSNDGYTLCSDLQLNIKKHNFGLSVQKNGNTDHLSPFDEQNFSKTFAFNQTSIFYGRSFSGKRVYWTINAGLGYFNVLKPDYTKIPNQTTYYSGDAYEVTYNHYSNIGAYVLSDLSVFFNEKISVGLLLNANINSVYSLSNISLALKFRLFEIEKIN